jgi:O-6-methylguanine DNA methyltransferase
MKIWVLVKKLRGKFVGLYIERYEITGEAKIEFCWLGDDLSDEDVLFLNNCVNGKCEEEEFLKKICFEKGTEFQKMVWRKICEIPRGMVWSYGEVAEEIGRPRAFRAVANACAKNPLALIVPCHRVVAAGGKLGGYFYDRKIKEVLLVWEGM